MSILTFKKVYLIHGKQRLERLWAFQPWFLSCNAGVTADADLPSHLDPPNKLSFVSYLVTNSICKLFVDVLFTRNTTFLNKGKKKKKTQPFRSNSTAFIIASRTVYVRIRCEQTTAFELLKLLQ